MAEEAPRETPLARALKARIGREGPLTVAELMTACLSDPEHGYYRRGDIFGRDGDFVTAPEISQVFGELLGLWSVVVWRDMGRPATLRLVELGPGRGTMLADALRAAARDPDFLAAISLHLVETSPALRKAQHTRLDGVHPRVAWHGGLDEVPAGPTILLANEFLDALPVRQLVHTDMDWRERVVLLDETGALGFGIGTLAEQPAGFDAEPGAILELRDTTLLLANLAARAHAHPLAALFIDYGHLATTTGDTLQAVRKHVPDHPLVAPGLADLTAHVDFAAFAAEARAAGLRVWPALTQAELLGALGIVERASRLMASNPTRATDIETAIARLMAPLGMGGRFKAIALTDRGRPAPPGFASAAETS